MQRENHHQKMIFWCKKGVIAAMIGLSPHQYVPSYVPATWTKQPFWKNWQNNAEYGNANAMPKYCQQ